MPERPLSELEGVVLGIVWKFGPCTPHAIRTHFLGSRSARFSGSAGAIYPLVARLRARGLLRSHPDVNGRQRRSLDEVTPQGKRLLVRWLRGLNDLDLGAVHDPVRIRVYFLAALPVEARKRFLEEARAGLIRTLELMQTDLAGYERDHSPLSALATRGAIELARAQLRWLSTCGRVLLKDRLAEAS
jgi:DNA-binding PadR family transcriptional regulator